MRKFFTLLLHVLMFPLKVMGWLFKQLFGSVHWNKPGWLRLSLQGICSGCKKTGIKGWHIASILVVGVVLVVGFFAYDWWFHKDAVRVSISAIQEAEIHDDKVVPSSLVLEFSRSAAPTNYQVGVPVSTIHLEPEVQGKWMWDYQSQLRFVSDADWPAGQKYKVVFEKGALAKDVKLPRRLSFSTPELLINIANTAFERDTQKSGFYARAEIRSNYELKPDSLTKAVAAEWRGDRKTEIKFDRWNRKAYINIPLDKLPEEQEWLKLKIAKGVEPVAGQASQDSPSIKIKVPDVYSFLEISAVTTQSLIDPKTESGQQVVSVLLSADMKTSQVTPHIKAVLLPEKKPGTQEKFQSIGQISALVLQQAETVELKPLPSATPVAKRHNFAFKVPAGRQVFVTVDKGLKTDDGFKLRQDHQELVEAPSYDRLVKIQGQGSLLARAGQQRLSIISRDVKTLQVSLYQVLPDRLPYLITQSRTWDYHLKTAKLNGTFREDDLAVLHEFEMSLSQVSPDQPTFSVIDLGEYLKPDRIGVFIVKVADKDNSATADRRMIVLTDMGLIVKKNADNTRTVFVQSFQEGRGIGGVKVEVLGRNGLPVATASTSEDGRAELSDVSGLKLDKEPVMITARRGADLAYIPYQPLDRELDYSRFEIGGETPDIDAKNLTAYLFTDRGLYRPGESVNLGFILHHREWQSIPQDMPVRLSLFDATSKQIFVKSIPLNKGRFLTETYALGEQIVTGDYWAQITLTNNKKELVLGSASFKVGFFEPDRLRIKSSLAKVKEAIGWLKPSEVEAKVVLENLFGAPAAGHKIETKVSFFPGSLMFKGYPDYVFQNPEKADETRTWFQEYRPAVETNEKGEAVVELDLNRFGSATYNLGILNIGYEKESGRSVRTFKETLVSSEDYLVGVKAKAKLDYLRVGQKAAVDVVAIDQNLKPAAVSHLKAEWVRGNYVSTLMEDNYGHLKYQSVLKEDVLATDSLALNNGPQTLTVKTAAPGHYKLNIRDPNGRILSTTTYFVAGQGTVSANPEQNAELVVNLDRTDYQPGQDIRVSIQAPFTGTGLITIERDKVYAAKWFTTTTTATEQTIALPSHLEGNAYVNVTFVRGLNDPNIYLNPLSYAVKPFSISKEWHRLAVDLKAPEKVKPGTTLTVSYKTSQPGKVIVWAVDEGILQVAKYQTPRPLDHLMAKQALGTRTTQMVDLLLPELQQLLQQARPGGGEFEEALSQHMNPFRRKGEPPVVFWSGLLDSTGQEQNLDISIPDYFSGELHLMAVAVQDQAIGVAEKRMKSQADVIVEPNAPLYVTPQDQFTATAVVFNNTDKPGTFEIELKEAERFSVLSPAKINVEIPAQQSRVAKFDLKAGETFGDTTPVWSVKTADQTYRRRMPMAIRPPVARQSFLAFKSFSHGRGAIPLRQDFYPQDLERKATVSALPTAFVSGLQEYLLDYPFGCTEQIISRALPAVVLGQDPVFKGVLQHQKKNGLGPIEKAIQALQARQNNDGSFGYWTATPGSAEAVNREGDAEGDGEGEGEGEENADTASSARDISNNDFFMQNYVAHALMEMRDRGIDYPPVLLQQLLDFLNTHLSVNVEGSESYDALESRDWAFNQAFSLYLLSRDGRLVGNTAIELVKSLDQTLKNKWHNDATAVLLAAVLKMQQQDEEAQRLLGRFNPTKTGTIVLEIRDNGAFLTGQFEQALSFLILNKHFPEVAKDKGPALMEKMMGALETDYTYNSMVAAYMIWALQSYAHMQIPQASLSLAVDQTSIPLEAGQLWQTALLPPTGKELKITSDQDVKVYAQVQERGYAKASGSKHQSKGLVIEKEIRDEANNVIGKAKLGQTVTVRLSIKNAGNQNLLNVSIVDLLPGGVEVVADSLGANELTHTSVQDDRILMFGDLAPGITQITYQLRATSTGQFVIPAAYAEAMYKPSINGLSALGALKVE